MLAGVEPHTRRRQPPVVSRWSHRGRVVEAIGLLAVAAIAQRWISMPRWSRLLGSASAPPAAWRGEQIGQLPLRWASSSERKVFKAVDSASRLVPWHPKCLAEATAGQLMLRRLGSPGVVVIGLRPSEINATERWDAHAWLLGRHGALTGGPAARGFTATTVFQVAGALEAAEVDLGVGHPRPSDSSADERGAPGVS